MVKKSGQIDGNNVLRWQCELGQGQGGKKHVLHSVQSRRNGCIPQRVFHDFPKTVPRSAPQGPPTVLWSRSLFLGTERSSV